MNTLIEITEQVIDGDTVQTVSARNLHTFLEVKTSFKDWIIRRIKECKFKEGYNFCSFLSESSGGRPSKEYYLTLDMAKHLSMIERNDKGHEARQYFIKCERLLKKVATPQINLANALENPLTIKQLLLESINQLEDLRNEVSTLKPKAEALEGLKRSDGLFGLIEAAKMLEIRPKELTDYLRKNDWVYRRAPGAPLLPYQDKIKKGFMDCRAITIQRPDGTEKVLPSTKITSRGLACLREQIHGGVQ
ncbi:antA/AntB antirepressor family protein [Bartonella senegalensis]|uniref:antA/AntB antirepressor family protein n=1 Tax=Bartonella senegalensis TaxID=1468418 RepID=UPI0003076667|nr:antA/AntB antirepressor family protein [Bartonella senegalensis]